MSPRQRLAVGHEQHTLVALLPNELPEEVSFSAPVLAPDREALPSLHELPDLPGEDLLAVVPRLAWAGHQEVGLDLHAGQLGLTL